MVATDVPPPVLGQRHRTDRAAARAVAGREAAEAARIGASIAPAICEEAKRGSDVIVLGSGEGPSIGGAVVEQVVAAAPCHVAIMKSPVRGADYKRILVPVDGSVVSRLAVELALRYAEATGAELALAILTERRPQAAAYADLSGTHPPSEVRATSDEELQRISVAFRASDIKPNILPPGVRSALERDRPGGRARALRPGASSARRTARSSTACSSVTRTSA